MCKYFVNVLEKFIFAITVYYPGSGQVNSPVLMSFFLAYLPKLFIVIVLVSLELPDVSTQSEVSFRRFLNFFISGASPPHLAEV